MQPNISTALDIPTREPENPWPAGITAVAVIIVMLLIMYWVFITFLLLHGTHRHQLPIQLAASCILSYFPAIIFLHPGSIHLEVFKRAMTLAYCGFFAYIKTFTQIITPYTLMMFSIERLMYINNPTAHAQKIKRAGHLVLLAFPWAISTILSILDVNLHLQVIIVKETLFDRNGNYTENVCYLGISDYPIRRNFDIVLRLLLGTLIPLFSCLIITIVVLVMWCCFKRKYALGRDYSMMGDQVEVTVRNSVIAVSVLNFLYAVIVFIEESSLYFRRWGFYLVMTTFFGVIEGVVWVLTFVDVRNKFVALFPCCPKKSVAESSTFNYVPDEGTTHEL